MAVVAQGQTHEDVVFKMMGFDHSLAVRCTQGLTDTGGSMYSCQSFNYSSVKEEIVFWALKNHLIKQIFCEDVDSRT